ncbi:hypothetical protein HK100_010049, partial [Physocladia obscura]
MQINPAHLPALYHSPQLTASPRFTPQPQPTTPSNNTSIPFLALPMSELDLPPQPNMPPPPTQQYLPRRQVRRDSNSLGNPPKSPFCTSISTPNLYHDLSSAPSPVLSAAASGGEGIVLSSATQAMVTVSGNIAVLDDCYATLAFR